VPACGRFTSLKPASSTISASRMRLGELITQHGHRIVTGARVHRHAP
jgi:hypothetical protein